MSVNILKKLNQASNETEPFKSLIGDKYFLIKLVYFVN